MQFLDFSTANSQITDEIINVSDSNPVNLKKSVFYNKTGKAVVISTAAGGGGTVLTETTDWVAGDAFPDGKLPTSISPDVGYTTIAIVNATYHSTDLYVSYYPITDVLGATQLNILPRIIDWDLVNDISATDITKTLPLTNTTQNGDRMRYEWQGGDGTNEFKIALPTGWTLEYNGTALDATALGRIGEGSGFIELEAGADNKVVHFVGYEDKGTISNHNFVKNVSTIRVWGVKSTTITTSATGGWLNESLPVAITNFTTAEIHGTCKGNVGGDAWNCYIASFDSNTQYDLFFINNDGSAVSGTLSVSFGILSTWHNAA